MCEREKQITPRQKERESGVSSYFKFFFLKSRISYAYVPLGKVARASVVSAGFLAFLCCGVAQILPTLAMTPLRYDAALLGAAKACEEKLSRSMFHSRKKHEDLVRNMCALWSSVKLHTWPCLVYAFYLMERDPFPIMASSWISVPSPGQFVLFFPLATIICNQYLCFKYFVW